MMTKQDCNDSCALAPFGAIPAIEPMTWGKWARQGIVLVKQEIVRLGRFILNWSVIPTA